VALKKRASAFVPLLKIGTAALASSSLAMKYQDKSMLVNRKIRTMQTYSIIKGQANEAGRMQVAVGASLHL
jgi:hypothetical protein